MKTFEHYEQTAYRRDDSLTRMIDVMVQVDRLDESPDILHLRQFKKWEGVGSLHASYVTVHLFRGHERLKSGQYEAALTEYLAAMEYLKNLEDGKRHRGGSLARPAFYVARVYKALGNDGMARRYFDLTITEADDAFEVRDPNVSGWISVLYYKGLSLKELGRTNEASQIFIDMVRVGNENLQASGPENGFAKFGEWQSEQARLTDAHCLTGLGYLGQGERAETPAEFKRALDPKQEPHGGGVASPTTRRQQRLVKKQGGQDADGGKCNV